MLKFIFLTALSAVIFFFVWNFLRRFFFNDMKHQSQNKNTQSIKEKKYKWDAETVDYEEVVEKKEKH